MKSGTYTHSSGIVVSPCEVEMERDEGDVKEYTFFRCHDKTNTLP